MKNSLKKIFVLLICIPVLFLCSCGGVKPTCKALPSLSYYFGNTVSCDIFNQSDKKSINTNSLENSKLNKDMLDKYAQLTLTGKSAEMYHLYIEYIYFKIYTNEESEFQLDVNINMTNVINESDIGNSEVENTTFSNTYACVAKKKGTVQVKIEVKRTVATATGSTLTIDVLTSDMFADTESNFKWCIYDFKIYGESRSY